MDLADLTIDLLLEDFEENFDKIKEGVVTINGRKVSRSYLEKMSLEELAHSKDLVLLDYPLTIDYEKNPNGSYYYVFRMVCDPNRRFVFEEFLLPEKESGLNIIGDIFTSLFYGEWNVD